MEQLGKYKIHELASKLPMMSDEEFAELKESIRTQGLLHPIIVSDNNPLLVIDGINRLKACLELMIEPRFVKLNDYLSESFERRELTWATDDLTGLRLAEEKGDLNSKVEQFIIMQNITRRHLSDWKKFKNILAFENGGKLPKHGGDKPSKKDKNFEEAKSAPSKVTDIAKALDVSPRKVKQMIAIEKNAPPEVKEKLNNDEMSINKAAEETKEAKKQKTEPKKKEKKLDWFEENIEDENERFLWKLAIETTKIIESKIGILYLQEFRELITKIDHINYKESWKEQQD